MKKLYFFLLFLGVTQLAYTQWNTNTNGIHYTGGSVGIGTNTPSSAFILDMLGNPIRLRTNGTQRATLHLYATGTGEAGIYFDASNGDGVGSDYGSLLQKDDLSVELNSYSSAPIHLRTANANRLTIAGNGNIGIGTSTPNTAYKLHTVGSIYTNVGHKVGEPAQVTNDAMFDGYLSSTSSGPVYGIKVMRYMAHSAANTGGVYGLHVLSGPSFTSTAQNVYGIYTRAQTFSSGSATNAYSLYSNSPIGNVTNAFNIYAAGSSKNYFGGAVGIGNDAPQAPLHVMGTSSSGHSANNTSTMFVENGGSSNSHYALQTATAGGGKSFSVTNAGNVGVGVLVPQSRLELKDSQDASFNSGIGITRSSAAQTGFINMVGGAFNMVTPTGLPTKFRNGTTTNLTILGNGRVGMGVESPEANLHIFDSPSGQTAVNVTGLFIENAGSSNGYYAFQTATVGGGKSFSITNAGNVGIGTTTPNNKLEVNGTIRSKKVLVQASPWPDYVFDSDYKLRSLKEVEAHIKVNKHLPEVPSAKEVEAQGLDLAEMNMLLMKKVEELTLYLIQENKEKEEMKALLLEMRQELNTLKEKK